MIYIFFYYENLFDFASVISNLTPKNMKGDPTALFQGQYDRVHFQIDLRYK